MAEESNSSGSDQELDPHTPLLKAIPVQRASAAWQNILDLLSDWWLWEITSAITCLFALAVIVLVLLIFDSSDLPNWPSVFTVRLRPSIVSPAFLSAEAEIDKFCDILLCDYCKTLHVSRGWGSYQSIEMAVVSTNGAPSSARSSAVRRCKQRSMGCDTATIQFEGQVRGSVTVIATNQCLLPL